MLDGELIADGCEQVTTGEGFRATSSIVRSGGDKTGVSFHVFDVVAASVFGDGAGNRTYRERRRMVDELPSGGTYARSQCWARQAKTVSPNGVSVRANKDGKA